MLHEYLFIDERRLTSYIQQIGSPRHQGKVPTWNVGLSIAGPKVSGRTSVQERDHTPYEMIGILEEYLERNGQLSRARPEYHGVHDDSFAKHRFVLERVEATKLVIPVNDTRLLEGLNSLSLWVAKPNPWSCLYLVESYWDKDENFSPGLSKLSALALILEAVGEASGCSESVASAPASGLWGLPVLRQNPLETFRQSGAFVRDSRQVEVLYKTRYVSDEALIEVDGEARRMGDVFAYPIYIRE